MTSPGKMEMVIFGGADASFWTEIRRSGRFSVQQIRVPSAKERLFDINAAEETCAFSQAPEYYFRRSQDEP